MLLRAHITYACALAQTAPLLSSKAMASFRLAACMYIDGVFDWKVQRFCWPKGTSLECVESIYVNHGDRFCDKHFKNDIGTDRDTFTT